MRIVGESSRSVTTCVLCFHTAHNRDWRVGVWCDGHWPQLGPSAGRPMLQQAVCHGRCSSLNCRSGAAAASVGCWGPALAPLAPAAAALSSDESAWAWPPATRCHHLHACVGHKHSGGAAADSSTHTSVVGTEHCSCRMYSVNLKNAAQLSQRKVKALQITWRLPAFMSLPVYQ